MREILTSEELNELGYYPTKFVEGRGYCGVRPMIYTTGLFYGITRDGNEGRYCFNTFREAEESLILWDGKGDPPGNWLKEKPSNRLGPGIQKDE
jgi:hypothetical protein